MKRYLLPVVAVLSLVLLLVSQMPVAGQAPVVDHANPITALQRRLDAAEQALADLVARVTALEANSGSSGATRKVLTKVYNPDAPDATHTYYEMQPVWPPVACTVTVHYVKFSFAGRSTADAPILQVVAPPPPSQGYAWNVFPPGARPVVVTHPNDLFAVLDSDTGLDVLFRVREHRVCGDSAWDTDIVPPDPDGQIRVTLVAIE